MRFFIALLAIGLFFSCQKESTLEQQSKLEKVETTSLPAELSAELMESIRAQGAGTYEIINGAPKLYAEPLRTENRSTSCDYNVSGTVGCATSTGESFYIVYNVRFPGDTIVTYAPAGTVQVVNVNFSLDNCESRSIPATYNGFGGLSIAVVQLTTGFSPPTQTFVVGKSTKRVFDNTTYNVTCSTGPC